MGRLTMLTHLLDDLVLVRLAKALIKLVGARSLALGNVREDPLDLEDLIQVGLDAGTPLLDLVLVAGDLWVGTTKLSSCIVLTPVEPQTNLETLAALLQSDDGDVGEPVEKGGRMDVRVLFLCVLAQWKEPT